MRACERMRTFLSQDLSQDGNVTNQNAGFVVKFK